MRAKCSRFVVPAFALESRRQARLEPIPIAPSLVQFLIPSSNRQSCGPRAFGKAVALRWRGARLPIRRGRSFFASRGPLRETPGLCIGSPLKLARSGLVISRLQVVLSNPVAVTAGVTSHAHLRRWASWLPSLQHWAIWPPLKRCLRAATEGKPRTARARHPHPGREDRDLSVRPPLRDRAARGIDCACARMRLPPGRGAEEISGLLSPLPVIVTS